VNVSLETVNCVRGALRVRESLTVPQICRDLKWAFTPSEVSNALRQLIAEGEVEHVAHKDVGCTVPTWRKAGAA
jgi:hypothetical protein